MASSGNNILAQIHYAQVSGLFDDKLGCLYDFREENNHRYFENLFTRFLSDTTNRLASIEHLLNFNAVDFYNLAEQSILLIGSSSTIGAFQLANACRDLRLAADNYSRNGCIEALNVVKRELSTVRPHLDAIIQVERETSF